jgi:hypothetical protein
MPQVYQQPQGNVALNRSHPLCNQLIFAYSSAAYTYGYANTSLIAGIDSVYGVSGAFTAVPTIPNKRYGTSGSLMNPGAGPLQLTFDDAIAAGNSSANGMTVACLVASDIPWVAAEKYVFGRRDTLVGANSGIALGNRNFSVVPGWQSEVSDGVTQDAIDTGVVTNYQNQDQFYLLVGVIGPDGIHSIYLDGILIRSKVSGMTFPLGTGRKTIHFLAAVGDLIPFDGSATCGFVWNRALTPQEIGDLYVDPFAIWKFPNAWEDDGLGISFQTALNSTFFLAF